MNFTNAAAFVREPLAVSGLAANESTETYTAIATAEGSMGLPFLSFGAAGSPQILLLPPTLRQPTDQLNVTVRAFGARDNGVITQREAGVISSAIPSTLTLPSLADFGAAELAFTPFSVRWGFPAIPSVPTKHVTASVSATNQLDG